MSDKSGSTFMKKAVSNGQTIVRAGGRDDSSFHTPAPQKMGGSTTNLDHSLKNTKPNQRGA